MALKEIVVHQGPDKRSQARLRIAADLAKSHGSRLIGVFVKPSARDREAWWTSFSESARAEWSAKLDAANAAAAQEFADLLAREGVEGEWRVIEGNIAEVLTTCARYSDLTVIGQTDPDHPSYPASMPDQVVLGAGGPVLVVPYAGNFETVGRRAMVAWNGGREAARAVRDALPLLRRAEVTKVYSLNPTGPEHLAGADISLHLARHGVSAEASRDVLVDGGRSNDVGETMLSAAADFGADLLVMGAYGHSRVREIALGGATQQILRSMTAPVLMSS